MIVVANDIWATHTLRQEVQHKMYDYEIVV